MKFLLLIVFSLAGIFASLNAKADTLAAIGGGVSLEYANDGHTYEARTPFLVRGGYRFSQADAYLEYSTFQSSDDNTSLVSVTRQHQEWIAWGRHIFLPNWIVAPYLAAGAGMQYDIVETGFGGETSRDVGMANALFATAAGIRLALGSNFDLELETRIGFSSGYAPNPMLGGNLLLGVNF
jgi:hypothetical protein